MAVAKIYNSDTGQWEATIVGATGATGPAGSDGALSPNYIINGAFDIWQRGTSFVDQNNDFTADRWVMFARGGDLTVSQEYLTVTDTTDIGFGQGEFYLRMTSTGGAADMEIEQPVEDVRTLAGQQATLSFYIKGNASNVATVFLRQNFGSGGSSEVTTSDVDLDVTTSWTRVSATIDVPSISGKTIGSGSHLRVYIGNSENESFTWDIFGVQLEAGSIATPFKRNANSIQGELAACSRYFERINMGRINTATSGNSTVMSLPYMTRKRSTPSVSTTATNANYGSVWSFSQSGVLLSSKSGTVTINFDGSDGTLNHLQINAVGATYSPIPNTLESLSGLYFDIDAEL